MADRTNYYGLSIETYQAIRTAIAKELAVSSRSFVVTATEAGAVAAGKEGPWRELHHME